MHVLKLTKDGKLSFPMQVGQLIMYYTPKESIIICLFFFLLLRPSKAGKESFLRQILLSDLRLDTYKRKQTVEVF